MCIVVCAAMQTCRTRNIVRIHCLPHITLAIAMSHEHQMYIISFDVKKVWEKLYGIACLAVDFILLDLIQNLFYVKWFGAILLKYIAAYLVCCRRSERYTDSGWYITYKMPWCMSYMWLRGDDTFQHNISECGGAIVSFRRKNIELILERFK